MTRSRHPERRRRHRNRQGEDPPAARGAALLRGRPVFAADIKGDLSGLSVVKHLTSDEGKADLFHDLPEIGDVDRPTLVFSFDEAHLLFNDASKAFLDTIAQTVRLIRSKGVGVFFATQSPTDVPDAVLAQLGSRVQHRLRASTPNDAKALKQTVNTYPHSSSDDLGAVILSLGIGEAVVTVMDERGAPTPVAWTRLHAPESLMGAADTAVMEQAVTGP